MKVDKPILFDFDGVIHKASKGYGDGAIYDEPIEGAVFTIRNLLDAGYKVIIFTSRTEKEWQKIRDWLERYQFPPLPITNIKVPALAYVDNKGIRFDTWASIAAYYL